VVFLLGLIEAELFSDGQFEGAFGVEKIFPFIDLDEAVEVHREDYENIFLRLGEIIEVSNRDESLCCFNVLFQKIHLREKVRLSLENATERNFGDQAGVRVLWMVALLFELGFDFFDLGAEVGPLGVGFLEFFGEIGVGSSRFSELFGITHDVG